MAGVVVSDRYRKHQEEQENTKQAKGVVLALLSVARSELEKKEEVDLAVWQETLLKGNLYPALVKVSRKEGYPDLPERVITLSVMFRDYNDRVANNTLLDDQVNTLHNEVGALIQLLEK